MEDQWRFGHPASTTRLSVIQHVTSVSGGVEENLFFGVCKNFSGQTLDVSNFIGIFARLKCSQRKLIIY